MVGSYVDFGVKTDRRLLDITDCDETLKVVKFYKPKTIIHLAAATDVDRCERDPEYAYSANTVGVYNIAAAAKEVKAKLVYVSTAGVFDGKKNGPYNEEDEPNPQNYYGRSKYLGELIVRGMLKDYIIARVCWVFGGGPAKDRKFGAKIIEQLRTRNPEIKAVDDQFSSPTFGKDLVAGIKYLLQTGEIGLFHLANKGVCSRYDLARQIVANLKSNAKVIPVNSSFFNLDAKRGNNEGLVSKTDIMRPWQEALKEYLETEWIPSATKMDNAA